MRIFVIGATGHTGTQLVDLALARGHAVTAFVRSPHKITRQHAQLTVVQGDPHDIDALARALPGHDAVVTALGMRPPAAFRPHSLVHDCAASTVAAMARAGVSRLVLVSVAVLFPLRGLVYALFRRILKQIALDQAAAESVIRASQLEWTIARPPRLTGARDEHYRSARDTLPEAPRAMSFRAVAAFILDALESRTHVREIVGLAR